MLGALDTRIIDNMDRVVSSTQRRGLNLLAAKVWLAFSLLIFALLDTRLAYSEEGPAFFVSTLLVGSVFGIVLLMRVAEFKIRGDYPDVARRMQRLNANVLRARERGKPMRFMAALFLAFAVLVDGVGHTWLQWCVHCLVWVLILLIDYADCCMFLGPGDHSRESRRVTTGDMVREHGR